MDKAKVIGYGVLVVAAVAQLIGLARIVHTDLTDTLVIGLGGVSAAVGWYLVKKDPKL